MQIAHRNRTASTASQRRSLSGQTLIIAILVLGVLLILGFTFASLVARNIIQATQGLQRSVANDLSEAGARYAHAQLLNSELGADWRPSPTAPPTDATGLTKDPDALYLRLGSGFGMRSDADQTLDRGGPDGLGPFTRVSFDRGRALVRVRYAPGDFVQYRDNNPTGPLRQPGRVRNFTIIESIGRPGTVNPNDPSTLLGEAVKVARYADSTEFRTEMGRLKKVDNAQANTRRLMAFASIGIIESARYIHNIHNVSRPAEIGSLTLPTSNADSGPEKDGLGAEYENRPVRIRTQLGGALKASNGTTVAVGTGSLWSNADVIFHGRLDILLDPRIGDSVSVAGTMRGANDEAQLRITRVSDNQTITLGKATNPTFTSARPEFTTFKGLVRDSFVGTDFEGYARSIGRKDPPSMTALDPVTRTNRYVSMTRNSGVLDAQGRNIGRLGYGRGIYVDSSERGNLSDEEGRERNDVARALVNDWLNPNNANSQAWQGPFYRPVATYARLLPDGFLITRDARSRIRFWRGPNGGATNTSTVRFRLRELTLPGYAGQTWIINSVQAGGIINRPAGSLSDNDFVENGVPFNGVLYFEGDVRVRGVIATDKQITLASNGTIYVEGSITKGIVDESGDMIGRASRSMLMLMARDYVAVNTTQFFAPIPGEDPKSKNADALPDTPNAIELDLSETPVLTLQSQFLLDPSGSGANEFNPQTWRPYALNYVSASGGPVNPSLLFSHSADDNGPSFVSLGLGTQTFADQSPSGSLFTAYLFPRNIDFNSAGLIGFNFAGDTNWFPGVGNVPMFGLGNAGRNAYPRFETDAFTIARAAAFGYTFNTRKMRGAGNAEGDYDLAVQDETQLQLRLTAVGTFAPKNYILSRLASTPTDVRIEAAMFAEEGAFFVIPGPSFNVNSDDTRARFNRDVANTNFDMAQRRRFEQFGAAPETPFYGEPLDARITVVGAVSENMPPPIAQQAEWQRRWGWIPRFMGATGRLIPTSHIPTGYNIVGANPQDYYVPNLTINYDPALALASADGLNPIRMNKDGQPLPPMPRLPVSPTLAYFGEVNP